MNERLALLRSAMLSIQAVEVAVPHLSAGAQLRIRTHLAEIAAALQEEDNREELGKASTDNPPPPVSGAV